MGANIEARDVDGMTPLHEAAYSGNAESINMLLDKGANARVQDKTERTPSDYAKENEKLINTKAYWRLHDLSFE